LTWQRLIEHKSRCDSVSRSLRSFSISARPKRILLVIIGAWLVLNVFLVVAAINDKLHSWVSYLFSASVIIGLVISGAILILP
jgi:hypothetical protein